MTRMFVYVVDRDFGFAPNPFHGFCTLATCKPRIRSAARIGDWVVGVGGGRLKATGHCIFAMKVGRKLTFDEYWNSPEFQIKKPRRNGSRVRLVGDNIYHRTQTGWKQADSHHSKEDGGLNLINLAKDTSADHVLVSNEFYYFGSNAVEIPQPILSRLRYKNHRNHRKFASPSNEELISWIREHREGYILGNPFDFQIASARYSGTGNKIHLGGA